MTAAAASADRGLLEARGGEKRLLLLLLFDVEEGPTPWTLFFGIDEEEGKRGAIVAAGSLALAVFAPLWAQDGLAAALSVLVGAEASSSAFILRERLIEEEREKKERARMNEHQVGFPPWGLPWSASSGLLRSEGESSRGRSRPGRGQGTGKASGEGRERTK